MSFDEFLNQARSDHATKTEDVARRLVDGFNQIERNEQIPQLAQFIAHVFGEHLGKWNEGIDLLRSLKKSPHFKNGSESEYAITRSVASLELASGKIHSVDDFSVSEQIRISAMAAAALAGRGNTDQARGFFIQALEKAKTGIDKNDPSNRALAVTANNLALSLEEKSSRTSAENELMILSAQTARKYWEIAGGWLEVERAEYRLAISSLQAGQLNQAWKHAQECLEISKKNQALPLELFFGFEALARVEKARDQEAGFSEAATRLKEQFKKMNADNQAWCEPILLAVIQ
jgi:hypothetical protein